jgi:hypothetical protein
MLALAGEVAKSNGTKETVGSVGRAQERDELSHVNGCNELRVLGTDTTGEREVAQAGEDLKSKINIINFSIKSVHTGHHIELVKHH